MAVIADGVNEALIDATSRALHGTYYDNAGLELLPPPAGVYSLPVNFIGSIAASPTQWTMRVDPSATKNIHIHRIFLNLIPLTGGSTTLIELKICRFSAATPSGGTALTPIKHNDSYPSSDIIDARQKNNDLSGLTMTGVTFETVEMASYFVLETTNANVTASHCYADLDFMKHSIGLYGLPRFAAGQGMALRFFSNNPGVAVVSGTVEWGEYAA